MKLADLQKAAYDRLVAEVGGLFVGIYTNVPQAAQSEDDSEFPFVTIGPFIPTPWDTDDTRGIQTLMDINVWSRSDSDLARRQLTDGVYNALNRYQLPIAGANTVDCLFDGMAEFDDPDGKTSHGVVTFRVTYDSI